MACPPFRLSELRWRSIAPVVLLTLSLSFAVEAGPRAKKRPKNAASFSYYMLVLSYAPDFCAQPQGAKDPQECGAGRRIGFVVHGLWPQGETSRGPENCGPVSPVSQDIINATLSYIPTESLIQHEWSAHGGCSGLAADAYFSLVRKARDSINIPAELIGPSRQLHFSPSDIESKFAAANASFPQQGFRASCYPNKELQEMRICFSKDLSPRYCGISAGQCTAKSVTLLPVR